MESKIRKILARERGNLLKKKGVVAVGMGYKVVDGIRSTYPCLTVSVEKKLYLPKLEAKDLVPSWYDGGYVITDVVETGIIRAMHTQRHRPAPGGVSIGEETITAGTLGCLVTHNGEIYILSNNHVLACSNNAEIGANILQPGPHDGGKYPADHIADLAAFVPIQMSGLPSECPVGNVARWCLNGLTRLLGSRTRFQVVRIQGETNLVDAAIARPFMPEVVSSEIMEIGKIKGLKNAELGMKIKKSGRTTGLTHGEIEQVNVTCQVQYGEGRIATFEDQIMAGKMCAGGDSGSVILTEDNCLVGLLFAGSENSMIANRIQNVFSLLDLEYV